MDGFAQTREPDDLFDDDFTPLDEPITQPVSAPSAEENADYIGQWQASQQISAPLAAAPPSNSATAQLTTSSVPHEERPPATTATTLTSSIANNPTSPQPVTSTSKSPPATTTDLNSTAAPTAPNARTVRIHTPVRGDRHLTGGVSKPKLTEEELSAKLAAAKLNSERLAEAHRLAEADEADFQAREARVQARRQEENRARRLMDQEREKNRMRKLGAKGIREWDEGKEDIIDDRGQIGRRGRGANGAVVGWDGRDRGGGAGGQSLYTEGLQFEEERNDSRGAFESRGRGGGRGGRGRGRGGFGHANRGKTPTLPDFLSGAQNRGPKASDPQQDFPALPPATKPTEPDKTAEKQAPATTVSTSWADQVADAQKA